MPAPLIPNAKIPELAARLDSLAMLQVLHHLQKSGFVFNDRDVTPPLADLLQRMTSLGLVDPGYEGDTQDRPYLWTGNGNGSRVLRHYLSSPDLREALESRLEIHPRAETALSALSEWEQAKVLAAVEALPQDPAKWAKSDALRLEEDGVFLLRVTPKMRAFVRVIGPGRVELIDLVQEETLKLFFAGQG